MSGLGDKPAFPGTDMVVSPTGREYQAHRPGITYRQWVAGLCAAGQLSYPSYDSKPAEVARYAVECADALIAALEVPPSIETPDPGLHCMSSAYEVACPECNAAVGQHCLDGQPPSDLPYPVVHYQRVRALPPGSPGVGR